MEVAHLLNIKYRVHEVAKDFGINSKIITDILTKYDTTPKNHMQALDERQLSLIFEYLTQHNQVESIESIFADVYHEPEAPKAPKAQGSDQGKYCKRWCANTGTELAPQPGATAHWGRHYL